MTGPFPTTFNVVQSNCEPGSIFVSHKGEDMCLYACDWDNQYFLDSECADKADLCPEMFFFSIETDECEQVKCPSHTYVTDDGMGCNRARCGENALL